MIKILTHGWTAVGAEHWGQPTLPAEVAGAVSVGTLREFPGGFPRAAGNSFAFI
jgi:hypothetical protein